MHLPQASSLYSSLDGLIQEWKLQARGLSGPIQADNRQVREPMEAALAMGVTSARSQPPIVPWARHEGQNELWYARFLRYVALGPERSVSLVARGRKNAYPVPAHWPVQAKQQAWKVRAEAFDAAAKADPSLVHMFNALLATTAATAPNGEGEKLQGLTYQVPLRDEYADEDGID